MRFSNGNIYLSKGKSGKFRNILEYDNKFYEIKSLSKKHAKSKGGNSSVFNLIDPNDGSELVIKFSKYRRENKNNKENLRFQNEINALYKAQALNFNNVINILFDGIHTINGVGDFSYYVMEKAETDLTNFLKNDIDEEQKMILCYEIIRGINELHSIDLFHRDIKPDNIFFIGNTWKIGDLGLSVFRNQNPVIDGKNEKIGPYGWLSPEVLNKVWCTGTKYEAIHDCTIDDFSDIFQLGKLIWFIFNGNIPIGQVRVSDFLSQRKDLFYLIVNMLQYKKSRRKSLNNYQDAFRGMTA